MYQKTINLVTALFLTQFLAQPMPHMQEDTFYSKYPNMTCVLQIIGAGTLCFAGSVFRIGCAGAYGAVEEFSKIASEAREALSETLWSDFSSKYPKTAYAISTTVSWAYWGAGVAWRGVKIGARCTYWGASIGYKGAEMMFESI